MATHSSILAWEIPWTEKPGRLQSAGRKEADTTERLTLSLVVQRLRGHGAGNMGLLPGQGTPHACPPQLQKPECSN